MGHQVYKARKIRIDRKGRFQIKSVINNILQVHNPCVRAIIKYLKLITKGDKSTRLIYSTEGGPENCSQTDKMLAHCLRMVDIENISKILLTFVGHRDKVTSIALHPELPIFASAGKVFYQTLVSQSKWNFRMDSISFGICDRPIQHIMKTQHISKTSYAGQNVAERFVFRDKRPLNKQKLQLSIFKT